MIRLVVCADDVGLDPGITDGALEAWRDGIVTDLSLLVARDDWGRTAAALKDAGVADVGVHLTLCEGRPVLPPHDVPTLVHHRGRLAPSGKRLLARYLRGGVKPGEVRREWLAQVRRAQGAGFRVTHLDGHKHLHLLPGLFGVALDVLQTCGVRGMRLPREGGEGPRPGVRGLLRGLSRAPAGRLGRGGVVTTDAVRGIGRAGRLTERALVALVDGLAAGTTELVCHPGQTGGSLPARLVQEGASWAAGYRWDDERAALTSPRVKAALEAREVQFVRWADL